MVKILHGNVSVSNTVKLKKALEDPSKIEGMFSCCLYDGLPETRGRHKITHPKTCGKLVTIPRLRASAEFLR